jgi:hypothetical protein
VRLPRRQVRRGSRCRSSGFGIRFPCGVINTSHKTRCSLNFDYEGDSMVWRQLLVAVLLAMASVTLQPRYTHFGFRSLTAHPIRSGIGAGGGVVRATVRLPRQNSRQRTPSRWQSVNRRPNRWVELSILHGFWGEVSPVVGGRQRWWLSTPNRTSGSSSTALPMPQGE